MTARFPSTSACLLAGVLGFAVPAPAADRTEPVHFAKGHSSATLKGSIKGYDGVVYQLGAREGQTMSVLFTPSGGSCYFNVLPPRAEAARRSSSDRPPAASSAARSARAAPTACRCT